MKSQTQTQTTTSMGITGKLTACARGAAFEPAKPTGEILRAMNRDEKQRASDKESEQETRRFQKRNQIPKNFRHPKYPFSLTDALSIARDVKFGCRSPLDELPDPKEAVSILELAIRAHPDWLTGNVAFQLVTHAANGTEFPAPSK